MNKRKFILSKLKEYKSSNKNEEESLQHTIKFIKENSECFKNKFKLGHITGSAVVVDKKLKHILLTHHRGLDKWFQLGGHSDGHNNPIEVGWREAEEESGLTSLEFISGYEGIFDVDVHPIPKKGDMPKHNHHDIRVLLTADIEEPLKISSESKDLKWVKLEKARTYNKQPAFQRLLDKVVKVSNGL